MLDTNAGLDPMLLMLAIIGIYVVYMIGALGWHVWERRPRNAVKLAGERVARGMRGRS